MRQTSGAEPLAPEPNIKPELDRIAKMFEQLHLHLAANSQSPALLINTLEMRFSEITDFLQQVIVLNSRFIESQNNSNEILEDLLQRNLDGLNNLNKNLTRYLDARQETKNTFQDDLRPPQITASENPASSSPRHTASVGYIHSSGEFEALIIRNLERIRQASSQGADSIKSLVQQLNEQFPIGLDFTSDHIFVIFNRTNNLLLDGRAFVFPGTYLGRPWIEWFEMPSGVYERVESTVTPATVSKRQNESWSLVELGRVSQQ